MSSTEQQLHVSAGISSALDAIPLGVQTTTQSCSPRPAVDDFRQQQHVLNRFVQQTFSIFVWGGGSPRFKCSIYESLLRAFNQVAPLLAYRGRSSVVLSGLIARAHRRIC